MDNSLISFTKNGKITDDDVSKLLNDYSEHKFLNRVKFSDNDLKLLNDYCFSNNVTDEKVYSVLSSCFIDRMMWTRARSCLYSRLYLLDNFTEEYNNTLKLLNSVDERIVAEIIQIPRSFIENLFFKDVNYNFSKWKSRMHYTNELTPYAYGFFKDKNSLTSISTTSLRPGDLILKTTPLVVAPWSFAHNKLYEEYDNSLSKNFNKNNNSYNNSLNNNNMCNNDLYNNKNNNSNNNNTYCCFHCLSVINKSFESLREDKRLIACTKNPRECNYYFCSKECLLNNGAVHSLECSHLIKLKKFSEYYLNPSLVLLVCRTLIKCSLNMDSTSRVCELDSEPNFSNEILDPLLNFNLDYSFLELYHHKVLEETQKFSSFLLEQLGFDFCLHLTTRELFHLTLVLWVNSVPFTSYLNYSFDNDNCNYYYKYNMSNNSNDNNDLYNNKNNNNNLNNYYYHNLNENNSMGGTVFSFKALEFKQSHTPNCVLHFDDNGKLTIRSIYEIPSGTELTTNTFIDKYLPPFIQVTKFWSVSSLFSYDPNDSNTNNYFKDLCSIRCSNCLNSFCYSTNYLLSSDSNEGLFDTNKSFLNYHWKCDCCNSPPVQDLDLLQNKAENTFIKARNLYFDGEFVLSKNLLLNFVNKWSSVLHPSHYLMYNSYLLLSGILMNKPGGNIFESLVYFRKALISLDSVLPKVCHERAYLYDRFADYLLKIKSYLRLKNNEYKNLKNLVMDSLYNSLWNWTVISGTESYQSILAMQKCRSVAFSLNIHSFPLSKEFIINVPNKYAHVFKAATGAKIVPDSFSNKMSNYTNFENGFDLQNLSDFYSVNDAPSMAFLAAQNGEFTDDVLDVLTTVQSYGLFHLGTGLSLLGIVASNLNFDFFTALLVSIYNRVEEHLLLISKSNDSYSNSSSDVLRNELNIMNLLYSVFGANELGVDPLIALITAPNSNNNCNHNHNINNHNNNSLNNNDLYNNRNEYIDVNGNIEKNMVTHLFGYASKFRSLINEYRTKIDPSIISPNFYKFICSDPNFSSYLLNRTTHSLLCCQTVLHYASSKGKNELVKYLLKQGLSVNTLNYDGANSLHLASFYGHTEVVKTLVEYKSNLHLTLKNGETPLHLAVYGLHIDTVILLLELYKGSTNEEFKGPSIWHALVSGIFRINNNDNDLESKLDCDSNNSCNCNCNLNNSNKNNNCNHNSNNYNNKNKNNIDQIVENLFKSIEISKILIKEMATEKYLGVYIWANYLPSQLLTDLWKQLLEGDSLFCFPKRPPTVYVVSNLNGIMEKPLKTIPNIGINGHDGLYGSLKQSIYDINNYDNLNKKNDSIFTATRTFQFLVEILKGLEEHLVNCSTH